MPNEVFQLQAVARVLEENVQLAEALDFPEISALEDAEGAPMTARKEQSYLSALAL